MENNLIVVKQLPIIEDQLRQVKASVDARVVQALALACTEETYKDVKKARAELNKEFQDLEARRREVKKAILAPYEAFEKLYKECAADAFTKADAELKAKIASVENGIKGAKREEIVAFYNEYRASLNIPEDIAPFERCGINITMSDSLRKLQGQASLFLQNVSNDLRMIETLEHKDEVLVEYRKSLSAPEAALIVDRRHKEMEEAGIPVTEEQINLIAEKRVKEEINRGVQVIQYQVITLMTTNGQAPFITVFMYIDEVPEGQTREDLVAIIEEMLHQRIRGVKNEKGVWITPAFPKLIYVLEEDNIHEDSKYYYLTKLAAECSAKRLVPDYISEKVMKELKDGNCYPCMGCRSFLTVYHDENNKPKFYGRFNQGVVTINLVDVACSSGKDKDRFWKIFDERLELCHRALMCRHNRLKGTPSDVAPILWQYGALARLKKGETIDKLLYNGYSTISLGYAGLCECVKYMTGTSHTDPKATPFALEIMQHMNDACAKWKAEHNIDFSLYGTPLESTTYKFAKCLQKRFGLIPGITDKNYITNSYHVHVTEKINAFDKLKFESQFQKLSPGGAISYVEVPNMQNNIDAVLSVMKYIYENIMYAELNTKSDYCQVCGYNGEIQIVSDDDGKLVWECPNCGNRNQDKMNVARRTCGYIGTQFWNQGRTQEIKERVLHL